MRDWESVVLAGRLAVNRTDIPAEWRALVADALHSQLEFAQDEALGDDCAESMFRAQKAEAALCDLLATLVLPAGAKICVPIPRDIQEASDAIDLGSDL
jgi:hypothetical protein